VLCLCAQDIAKQRMQVTADLIVARRGQTLVADFNTMGLTVAAIHTIDG
jgi:hypothetical protein